MAKERKVKVQLLHGGEVQIWQCRLFLSDRMIGCFSAKRNQLEVKLNKLLEQVHDVLQDLEQENILIEDEVEYAKEFTGNTGGFSEPFYMDEKELEPYLNAVPRPEAHWREELDNRLLRKYNLNKGDKVDRSKKSKDAKAPLLAGVKGAMTFISDSASEAEKEAFKHDFPETEVVHLKDPDKDGGKKGKNAWKNRRKGESEEEYKARIAEGPPN